MIKFYKEGKRGTVCLLCRHYCDLKEEESGICGVNKNIDSKIENSVYGRVSALNLDPIEKKPLYHFLPSSFSLSLGTVGCNFRCPFCQNYTISQNNDISDSTFIEPAKVISLALKHDAKSISYTYNEPTVFYPYLRDIAVLAKEKGLKNVMVSNGFESVEVLEDMRGLIDGINVDLKSFQEGYYKKELKGTLDGVLDTLKMVKKSGIWLEVTTLVVPTKNDSKEELEKMASFVAKELGEETPWHISAFHPDFKERKLPRTGFESLKSAYEIGKEVGLKYVYMGNIGIENPTVCDCGEVLIKRAGFEVIYNALDGSKCPKCSKELEGVFE